jgi:hypothetical protein
MNKARVSYLCWLVLFVFLAIGGYMLLKVESMNKDTNDLKDKAADAKNPAEIVQCLEEVKAGMEKWGIEPNEYVNSLYDSGEMNIVYRELDLLIQDAQDLVSSEADNQNYTTDLAVLKGRVSRLDLHVGTYYQYHAGKSLFIALVVLSFVFCIVFSWWWLLDNKS